MDGAWCGFIPSPNQLWPLCWKRGINNSGLGFTKVRVWSQWPAYTKNFKVEFPSLFWPWKPSSAGRTGLCSIHVGSGQFSYTPISSWHNLPTSLKPQIKLWGIKVKSKIQTFVFNVRSCIILMQHSNHNNAAFITTAAFEHLPPYLMESHTTYS